MRSLFFILIFLFLSVQINFVHAQEITSISVTDGPSGLVVDPNLRKLYVANTNAMLISIIDTSSNTLLKEVHTNHRRIYDFPYRLTLNPTTQKIYVSSHTGGDSFIYEIDGFTNSIREIIWGGDNYSYYINVNYMGGILHPRGITINPNTNTLYSCYYHQSRVVLFTLATSNRYTSHIGDSYFYLEDVHGASETKGGQSAYKEHEKGYGDVFGHYNGYHGLQGKQGEHPEYVAVNPTTNRAYVVTTKAVYSYDTDEGSLLAIKSPNYHNLHSITLNPNTNKLYVGNSGKTTRSYSIVVIDGLNNSISSEIKLDAYIVDLAINPDTNKLYVLLNDNGISKVAYIDASTNTILGYLVVGDKASISDSITVDPSTEKVYVSLFELDLVKVIDFSTKKSISQEPSSVNNNIEPSGDKSDNGKSSESSGVQSVNGVNPSANDVVNNSNGLQGNKSESPSASESSNANGASNSSVEPVSSGRPEGGRPPEANTTNNGSGNSPDPIQSNLSPQPATTQSTINDVSTPSTSSVTAPPVTTTQPNIPELNHGVGNGNGVGNSKH